MTRITLEPGDRRVSKAIMTIIVLIGICFGYIAGIARTQGTPVAVSKLSDGYYTIVDQVDGHPDCAIVVSGHSKVLLVKDSEPMMNAAFLSGYIKVGTDFRGGKQTGP